ncbi:MAG: alpha/beta hydrolase [Rhodobacterales bacterium]|nr:alpha/beta hydrolase [Rhodobacterales bacterium]
MENVNFEIDGQRYFARTTGDKANPLLLFLHGFPEYSGAWAAIMEDLQDRWFCVAPDQRGYGESWRPVEVEHYEMKHLSADVIAMIDHFGGGRAAGLVGHDWGASVAYATAMRAAAKIDRLVVINGVHPAPFQAALAAGGAQSEASQYIEWLRSDGSGDALARDDFAGMFGFFSAKMDMKWLSDELMAQYRVAWRDAAGVRAMVNWYRASTLLVADKGAPIAAEKLPQWKPEHLHIAMPHLLIWGRDDAALLPETTAGLGEYCADLTRIDLSGRDHWVIHQDPARISAEIRDFLLR